MARHDVEGAWYSRDGGNRYVTRGAEVEHGPGGWFAKCGRKVRGPLSCLPVAIEVADRMLVESATSASAKAPSA